MKKISINYFTYDMLKCKTAWSKARLDCGKILNAYGYKEKCIFISRKNIIKTMYSILKTLLYIKYNSEVIIQYPLSDNNLYISQIISNYCKIKKCKLSYLIHDINSLRYTGKISKKELNILRNADHIIIHNNEMEKLIKNDINKCHFHILQVFDYFVNKQAENHDYDNTVVYAGNLNKSSFLTNIKNLNIKFNLYGTPTNNLNIICNDMIQYKGAFLQDDLSIIKGDWGLVWDGSSIKTCDGIYGQYIKYNAPHKLSLYIVANLPIIIWKHAAEAKFITDNKLGISIDSLFDIKAITNKISPEEYLQIKENIKRYSDRLRKGENLRNILSQLK